MSQNPKSSFEEDLARLSQEVRDLKEDNSEKDQHWARPELPKRWDPDSENLIFQQIDCEEGTLDKKATIQLFGVTEVFRSSILLLRDCVAYGEFLVLEGTFGTTSCYGLSTLSLRCCSYWVYPKESSWL